MNNFKKIICLLITLMMVISILPVSAYAAEENIYSIQNDYIRYSINAKTGGFSIETLDGNPQKEVDNNIPLLYREDADRSCGTSFTTIRIDGKDYIFGRSYGFFGLSTVLSTPVVSEGGRLITVDWKINDYVVTQQVAVSEEADDDLTGNVGVSYTVKNTGNAAGNVGVRVLLDTALDSTVDSPYLVKDDGTIDDIIRVETEFSKEKGTLPAQIRGVDSLEKPGKMLYTFTETWNNEAAKVDRIIAGHWRNLANTRYEYTPDAYCDFTNYSNSHFTPDSALAYYWDEASLPAGESKVCELIYGVGNFSQAVEEEGIGLDMSIDNKIRLNDKGDGYANDGKFDVTVVVDNSVTDAQKFSKVNVKLSYDKGIKSVDGYDVQQFDNIEIGDVKTLRFHLQADPQAVITSKTVGVTLTGTQDIDESNSRVVTLNAQRTFVLPGTGGNLPEVKVSSVTPEIVYTQGEKTFTIAGDLTPLSAIEGTNEWKLKLYHTTTDEEIEVSKNDIAFIDETYTQMTVSTDKELTVGKYEIGFEFSDSQLVSGFGVTELKLGKTFEVSNDARYRTRTYGLMALVRYNQREYAFVPFANQQEYDNFLDGLGRNGGAYSEANGYPDIEGKLIPPFRSREGLNEIEALDVTNQEIMLIMRGSFKELTDDSGKKYYQASYEDGDILINEMLAYTGDEPLTIKEEGGIYKVSGDGKIGVVNSIGVWSDKWFFAVNKGTVTSLDADHVKMPEENVHSLELTLDGVGYMVQALGGFLIDIKYGVMSAERPVAQDRTLAYGISFGGSISIPISIPKSSKNKNDTAENDIKKADEDIDYSDALQNLFKEEEETTGNDTATQDTGTMVDTSKTKSKTTKPESDFKKDTNLSEGLLSASIDDVRFGQQVEENDDGTVSVGDSGFIGIRAALELGLPKDVLGNLISNAPGVYAKLTIDTIEHFYMIEAGLDIKLIQCEGVLSFMMTDVKGVDVVVPDSIQFYIRDGLKIPLAPPVFYMTGLGGGVDNLADTIGGEFSKLPPITLLLFTRLELVELMIGDFDLSVALSGLSVDGDLSINVTPVKKHEGGSGGKDNGNKVDQKPGNTNEDNKNKEGINGAKNSPKNPANRSSFATTVLDAVKSPVNLKVGASARWIDPICFKGYGDVTVIGGLLSGGISITITDKSFYGYAYLALKIPDAIPIIGGKELAGLEAAISDKFLGANIRILGIKLGFIYYWDGDFSFGSGINLMGVDSVDYPEYNTRAVFGTNMRKLKKNAYSGATLMAAGEQVSAEFTAAGSDSVMVEILFEGNQMPGAEDFAVVNPDGKEIELIPDNGNGGGTYLVQSRDEGNFIYVSVNDESLIKNGTWTVKIKSDKLSVSSFDIYAVDDIPELQSISYQRGADTSSYDLDISWALDSESSSTSYLEVYISEDKDILEKIKATNTKEYEPIERIELSETKSGSQKIQIPDGLESGTYYVCAMLSNNAGGMSTAINTTPFVFVNKKLPKPVKSAEVKYAGNGELYVEIEDAENPDYTHYVVEVLAEDGATLSNNFNEYAVGEDIYIGKEANLSAGSNYYVNVKTLRDEGNKKFYYGGEVVKSNVITMPEISKPVLESVVTNIKGSVTSEKNLEVTYNFDRPVWMYANINESTMSATRYMKSWTLTHELEDGDYIVDFTAYGESKDSVTSDDFPNIENAKMGFTVDSTLPALSIKKTAAQSLATEGDKVVMAQFGSNVVFADKEGNFKVEGITEHGATLTVDGIAVEVGNNGTFTYNGKLESGAMEKEMTFVATDKAGNKSQLTVYAVLKDRPIIEYVKILMDGKAVSKNTDGDAVIHVKNGNGGTLTLMGYTKDGEEVPVEKPVWEFLYEKNIVEFDGGVFIAKSLGETAIKASVKNGEVTLMDSGENADLLTEDYVIISIEANSKDDLLAEINAAEENIKDPGKANESAVEKYRSAIDAAKAVYNNESASADEIEKATATLKKATKTFTDAKLGIKSSGGGGGIQKTYAIKIEDTQNGSVKASHGMVYSGNSVTITSTPDAGYEVDEIFINDVSYGISEIITIASVVENLTVSVKFRPQWQNPFTDVTKQDWFYYYIRWAHEGGIMKGVSDTLFSPNAPLTRAMLVTILWRTEGEIESGSAGFSDVAEDSYYHDAVAWAKENGIVKGYSDTVFAPDDNITREQIAAIMHRYAAHKKYDVSKGEGVSLDTYDDAKEISEYAAESMRYAVGSGLIKGKSDKILDPKGNATRAESATILERFVKANK